MKEEEKFICPLCQELYGKQVPMKEGLYEERVREGLIWRAYLVTQGGLVCTENSDHHIGEDRYELFRKGEISRQRILAEMGQTKNGHLTDRLLKHFGREKRRK